MVSLGGAEGVALSAASKVVYLAKIRNYLKRTQRESHNLELRIDNIKVDLDKLKHKVRIAEDEGWDKVWKELDTAEKDLEILVSDLRQLPKHSKGDDLSKKCLNFKNSFLAVNYLINHIVPLQSSIIYLNSNFDEVDFKSVQRNISDYIGFLDGICRNMKTSYDQTSKDFSDFLQLHINDVIHDKIRDMKVKEHSTLSRKLKRLYLREGYDSFRLYLGQVLNEFSNVPFYHPRGGYIDAPEELHSTHVPSDEKFVYTVDDKNYPITVTVKYAGTVIDENNFSDRARAVRKRAEKEKRDLFEVECHVTKIAKQEVIKSVRKFDRPHYAVMIYETDTGTLTYNPELVALKAHFSKYFDLTLIEPTPRTLLNEISYVDQRTKRTMVRVEDMKQKLNLKQPQINALTYWGHITPDSITEGTYALF